MDVIQRINTLLDKYTRKQITPEELDELLILMTDVDETGFEKLSPAFLQLWELAKKRQLVSTASQVNWSQMYQHITGSGAAENKTQTRFPIFYQRFLFRAAAVLVLVTGLGVLGYRLLKKASPPAIATNAPKPVASPQTILPGKNNPILTLGDGSRIVLDEAKADSIDIGDNGKAYRAKDGNLVFSAGPASNTQYNTISTPNAAQCSFVLSDGTRIWLNAASSLRFPVHFLPHERVVELSGEGYFEVAKKNQQPFRVLVAAVPQQKEMEVNVLGTHFNINAYADEDAIKTTLLEGRVQVKNQADMQYLTPGKQARLSANQEAFTIEAVNVKDATAWKDGYFQFDKANVQTILRQVARWYNLEIVYNSTPPDMAFSGKIQRDLPLSGVLHILEQENIHFRLEGRKMTVIK